MADMQQLIFPEKQLLFLVLYAWTLIFFLLAFAQKYIFKGNEKIFTKAIAIYQQQCFQI